MLAVTSTGSLVLSWRSGLRRYSIFPLEPTTLPQKTRPVQLDFAFPVSHVITPHPITHHRVRPKASLSTPAIHSTFKITQVNDHQTLQTKNLVQIIYLGLIRLRRQNRELRAVDILNKIILIVKTTEKSPFGYTVHELDDMHGK